MARSFASFSKFSATESRAGDRARQTVEQVLHGVAYDRNDDIYFAARAVDAEIATTAVDTVMTFTNPHRR